MQSIWRYQLKITDSQSVSMPSGARILCAQFQYDILCIWAIVDARMIPTERIINIYGTGHPFNGTNESYIGTVQQQNLVWHIFEKLINT